MKRTLVSLGWGATVLVPTKDLSTFLAMIDKCSLVDSTYLADERRWYVVGQERITVDLLPDSVTVHPSIDAVKALFDKPEPTPDAEE